MTTPTIQQQAGQAPPPPPQTGDLVQTTAMVLAAASTVGGALGILAPLFAVQRLRERELESVLGIVMGHPPEARGISGVATAKIWRVNLVRRAQFVVSATKRLTVEVAGAVSRGELPTQALVRGVEAERRWYAQHLLAGWNRMDAAAKVDTAVMEHGLLLGWNTVTDRRTSPECRAANGANFRADQMPRIGYPGMVHPHCRCYAGPPRAGARMLAALPWAA